MSALINFIEASPTFQWILQIKTANVSLFQNWKLATLARVIQVLGLTFTLKSVLDTGYLEWRVEPRVTVHSNIRRDAAYLKAYTSHDQQHEYCNVRGGNQFEIYAGENGHRILTPDGCVEPLPGDEWQRAGDNTILIPTYVIETLHEQDSDLDNCIKLKETCTGRRKIFKAAVDKAPNGKDLCTCETKSEFFVAGIGALTMEMYADFVVETDFDPSSACDEEDPEKCVLGVRQSGGVTGSMLRRADKIKIIVDIPSVKLVEGKPTIKWNRIYPVSGKPIYSPIEQLLTVGLLEELIETPNFQDLKHVSTTMLDKENPWFKAYKLEEDGNKTEFHPTFRMTGLEIEVQMNFENAREHRIKDHPSTALKVNVKAKPGWRFQSQKQVLSPTNVMTGKRKLITREYQGLVIKTTGGGKFSGWSTAHFFSFVSSVLVFYTGVEILVGGMAMYLFGRSADYWYYEVNERVRMKRGLAGLIARLLGWYNLYTMQIKNEFDNVEYKSSLKSSPQTAQTEGRQLYLTREELLYDINRAFRAKYVEDDPFVKMILRDFSKMGSKDGEVCDPNLISVAGLTAAAALDERIPLVEYEEIYDYNRPWSLPEKIFLPAEEKDMRGCDGERERLFAKFKNLMDTKAVKEKMSQTIKRT